MHIVVTVMVAVGNGLQKQLYASTNDYYSYFTPDDYYKGKTEVPTLFLTQY